MIKKSTIPTIAGIFILLIGSLAGVFLLKNTQVFKIGASAEAAPKNIRLTNIEDTSVNISWTTDKATLGFVEWGNSQGDTSKVANQDISDTKTFTHSISLSALSPVTKYYFKINSDGSDYNNEGIPWKISTGPTINSNKNSILISGNVTDASGKPEKGALVYANISGYPLSTITSDTGNYVFQIAGARTSDLKDNANLDINSTLIELSIEAPPDGIASAQVYPKSGNPVSPITIGQTYDFRNEAANTNATNPSATLVLPSNAPEISRFNVAIPSINPKPTSVILDSINEGETVTSQKPEFFGKGPSGTTLTITIHSDNPITQSVQVPQNGSWSFAVPSNLSPGNHTITISWIDISGITRTLTRDFVVKAGEVPAFTASNSGTTPSPIPTASSIPTNLPTTIPGNPTALPTIIPTVSPIPTIGPTSVPTLIPSPSPTLAPIPVTGDLTPTIILSIMGLSVLFFSLIVWKVAES